MNIGLAKGRATGKGMVELSKEEMDRHQYLLHQKMKEAEAKSKTQIDFVETVEEPIKEETNDSPKSN
jgi:hypothetical protein